MQASQITTGLRQFRTICTPLSVFVCRGYELGYELCLLGAKRCTLRQTQGNKKKSHKSLNLWDLSVRCPVLSVTFSGETGF